MEERLIDIRLTPAFINTLYPFPPPNSHSLGTYIEKLFNRLHGWTQKGLQTASGKQWQIKQYVVGREQLDKYGRQTHLHYHVSLILVTEKTTKQLKHLTQEYLRRNGAKGNAAYMVRVNVDVKDENRWFRYAMKQGDYQTDYVNHLELSKLAQDEYKNQILKNLESEEKQRNKNQFRDKMYKHLDDTKCAGTQNIMKAIFHYYNSNGRDAPLNELSNKAMNYEILRGQRDLADIFKIDKNQINYI